MLKKTITYKDYDGVERTEDFYFNLSKAELIELQMSKTGGFAANLQNAVNKQDNVELFNIIKLLITKAYGVKTADGRRFQKSEEAVTDFLETEAYSELLLELFADPQNAADFINAIMPKDLINKATTQLAAQPVSAYA